VNTIFFRCDASPNIGSGHVMRCITLAKAMKKKGWNCSFLVSDETEATVPNLKTSGFKIHPDSFTPDEANVLIIDHYQINTSYETKARKWAQHIVVIDDLANRDHDCDLLIDPTYNRNKSDYKDRIPVNSKILTGSEYAILRPEFQQMRNDALKRRTGNIERILVSLGATNVGANIEKVITALINIKNKSLKIDLVIGHAVELKPDLKEHLEQLKKTSHNVNIYHHADNIAELMCKADLAIGAGGTTSWERCCLGLPTLMMEIADNQNTLANNLSEAGAVENLGWHKNVTPETIEIALNKMLQDSVLLQGMSRNAALICDGKGTGNIITAIENIILSSSLTLRAVTADDSNILLKWRNDKMTRQASIDTNIINQQDHEAWLKKALSNDKRELYIAEISNTPVATSRIDTLDQHHAEISWTVSPDYRGRGVGKILVQKSMRLKKNITFIAKIKKENAASFSIAKSVGMDLLYQKGSIVIFKKEMEE